MEEDFESLYESYKKRRKEAESDDGTPQYNSQFEDITQLSNRWGYHGEAFKTSEKQSRDSSGRKKPSDGKFSDFSLLLRRIYTWNRDDGEKTTMRLEIQSTSLRLAFKQIAKGFTSISLDQDPIMIEEPFSDLYFCRDRIQKAIEDASSEELKKELELLETFRKSYMTKIITTIESSLADGMIKAEDLWSLFPVGSEIILQNRNNPGRILIWCVVVKSCFYEQEQSRSPGEPAVWTVNVEFTSFKGKRFERVERPFQIGGFQGSREIRSLPAYPLDLHPQKEELRQSLICRGKRYVELCIGESRKTTHAGQGTHCSYSGPFWKITTHLYEPSSRVGIDFFSNPDCQVCL